MLVFWAAIVATMFSPVLACHGEFHKGFLIDMVWAPLLIAATEKDTVKFYYRMNQVIDIYNVPIECHFLIRGNRETGVSMGLIQTGVPAKDEYFWTVQVSFLLGLGSVTDKSVQIRYKFSNP